MKERRYKESPIKTIESKNEASLKPVWKPVEY